MSPSLGVLVLLPLLDEVPVRFPWYSGLWWTHGLFHSVVPYTTNILFCHLFYFLLRLLDLPESRLGGP